MIATKEHLAKELDALDEQQLKKIADFIAFIKYKALYSNLAGVDTLYAEFAAEDQQLAEEGAAEYADMLKKEDSL
jgi:hypothetical protein